MKRRLVYTGLVLLLAASAATLYYVQSSKGDDKSVMGVRSTATGVPRNASPDELQAIDMTASIKAGETGVAAGTLTKLHDVSIVGDVASGEISFTGGYQKRDFKAVKNKKGEWEIKEWK
jgi:hypothetical protein